MFKRVKEISYELIYLYDVNVLKKKTNFCKNTFISLLKVFLNIKIEKSLNNPYSEFVPY